MDNYIESSKKKKKGNGDLLFYGVVIVLLIVVICIIVYKDYLRDDSSTSSSNSVELINGYWGDYNIYLTEVDSETLENEYMLILFEPSRTEEKNQGFFQVSSASSMEYNMVINGNYVISDGKITFSQNLATDEEKSNFATYLGVNVSDLYQNEDDIEEGYNYLYNVDLTFTDSSIASSTITFKLGG